MKALIISRAAILFAAPAVARQAEPIALRRMSSWHVGGRVVDVSGDKVEFRRLVSRHVGKLRARSAAS